MTECCDEKSGQNAQLSNFDLVKEFHTAFGCAVSPSFEDDAAAALGLLNLCCSLLFDEVEELREALGDIGLVVKDGRVPSSYLKARFLKEVNDCKYLLNFLGVTFDINMKEAFKRVHESNMSKLASNGKPVVREDGKILKSKNYQEPDLTGLW